jgi:multidrug resistance efflux pump
LVGQVAALSRKLKQYLHQGRLAEDQQRELEVKHKKVEDELARIKLNGEMEGVLSKEDVRNGQISLIKVHL